MILNVCVSLCKYMLFFARNRYFSLYYPLTSAFGKPSHKSLIINVFYYTAN